MDTSKYTTNSTGVNAWIKDRFIKRECIRIVPTTKDSTKCGCGRYLASHYYFEEEEDSSRDDPKMRWNIARCTGTFATDSFGTLAFHGLHCPNRSQFIRLDFTTEPADIWRLLVDVWGVEPPKLVITVHGSSKHFELQPHLFNALQKDLHNTAKTTNAWIITSGIRVGVVKHVVSALSENISASKLKFTTIGIVPWGCVQTNEDFITVPGGTIPYYHQTASMKSRLVTLCEGHTCFLFVDNGTIGNTGADIYLRRRLEGFLKEQLLQNTLLKLPMISLVLGGGRTTLQRIILNVTSSPPVPVVIFSGSGRLSDVLSFALNYEREEQNKEKLVKAFKHEVLKLIMKNLNVGDVDAQKILKMVVVCSKFKNLVTVFSNKDNDSNDNLDIIILKTLFDCHDMSPVDQLALLLTWNRDDMAKQMFRKFEHWPDGSLNQAMMHALISNQVEFVELLLNNGMTMDIFLTYFRLEELYNTDDEKHFSTLNFLLQDLVKKTDPNYTYKMWHIGQVIEKLMGGSYQSQYSRQNFRRRYKTSARRLSSQKGVKKFSIEPVERKTGGRFCADFQQPFHDLFLWAVLTKRHEMAKCMWKRGENPLAKALVGFRLNKSLAKEATNDTFHLEICQEFKKNANEFIELANNLIEQLYQIDDDLTFQLLTCELTYWSRKTCLSLAALSRCKTFLAHASCQLLLSDLWLGGLRVRKKAHIKVAFCVFMPLAIRWLQFKTREQLLLQAQTAEELQESRPELNNYSTSDVSSSSSRFDSSDDETGESNDAFEGSQVASGLSSWKFPSETIKPTRPRAISQISHISSEDLLQYRKNGLQVLDHTTGNVPYFTSTPRHSSDVAMYDEIECNHILEHPNLLPQIIGRQQKLHTLLFESGNEPFHQQLVKKLYLKRNLELPLKKKILEFYRAPIACFWSFVIGYIFFLGCYTYTVLVRTLPVIQWPEYYVIAFVTTFAVDQIRKVLLQEPKDLRSKLKVYSQNYWNFCSCAACLMFFVALFFRVSQTVDTMMAGRVLYCCNITFWYMRILHSLTVSSMLGPFIAMYGKMVVQLMLMSNILLVVLASFGIVRQSLMFPYEEWRWALLRNVTFKPYFMLYGSLFPDETDVCGDMGVDCDVPGVWLTPIFMTIYLLLGCIVFVNMMVAAFNYVFMQVRPQAQIIWKFQRFEQVIEYEQQPFLPPPFVIFAHIYYVVKFIYKRLYKRDKKFRFEHSLKLFLNDNELDKLHDFEREALEELLTNKRNEKVTSTDERIKQISETMDEMQPKLDSLYDQVGINRVSIKLLQEKINDNCSTMSSGRTVCSSLRSTRDLRLTFSRSLTNLKAISTTTSFISRESDTFQQREYFAAIKYQQCMVRQTSLENSSLKRNFSWPSANFENFSKRDESVIEKDAGMYNTSSRLI